MYNHRHIYGDILAYLMATN